MWYFSSPASSTKGPSPKASASTPSASERRRYEGSPRSADTTARAMVGTAEAVTPTAQHVHLVSAPPPPPTPATIHKFVTVPAKEEENKQHHGVSLGAATTPFIVETIVSKAPLEAEEEAVGKAVSPKTREQGLNRRLMLTPKSMASRLSFGVFGDFLSPPKMHIAPSPPLALADQTNRASVTPPNGVGRPRLQKRQKKVKKARQLEDNGIFDKENIPPSAHFYPRNYHHAHSPGWVVV